MERVAPNKSGGGGSTGGSPSPTQQTTQKETTMTKAKHRTTGRPYPWAYELMYYKQIYWTVVKPFIKRITKRKTK